MKLKLINLRPFFQYCWNCNGPTGSVSTLCPSCILKLETVVDLSCNRISQIETFSLFYLVLLKEKHDIEFNWIYSLKKAKCHKDNFNKASELLIKKMILNQQSFKNSVLVTPPSEHSFNITKVLSENLNIEFYYDLYEQLPVRKRLLDYLKPKKNSQKYLNVIQRNLREYHWRGPNIENRKVIFIDDVVTTGSTAVAVWEAIGKPKEYSVWCLGYRPKLRI